MKTQVTISGTVLKETEKAMQVEIIWQHIETVGKLHNYTAWLPKSQSEIIAEISNHTGKNIIHVAKWLGDKLGDEIREKFGMCKNMGGNGIVYNL